MKLSDLQLDFMTHWGEMGNQWGINRTMAQIHAVLYLAERPLNAEELTEAVGVARSNVSVCLRELQGWRIIKRVHVTGDRRDHFVSLTDVWEMFTIILEERKRREFDPTLAKLQQYTERAKSEGASKMQQDRLNNMLRFFEQTGSWYDHARHLSPKLLQRLFSMGSKLRSWLGKD